MKFVVIFTLIFIVQDVYGHGRLRTPPSRASMWRDGFDNPPDYSDNQGFCGGATVSNFNSSSNEKLRISNKNFEI